MSDEVCKGADVTQQRLVDLFVASRIGTVFGLVPRAGFEVLRQEIQNGYMLLKDITASSEMLCRVALVRTDV
jgi:hypothetical protein